MLELLRLDLTLSDYYSVVDSLTSRLTKTGVLGVCDFYGKHP
jgi:hypothetical protein